MILAVEDSLSEAVCRRLVRLTRPTAEISAVVGLTGHGSIRRRLRELNRSATALDVLLLTDLNSAYPCPGALLLDWLSGLTLNARLFFRVAVREVEAWVLADRTHFAAELQVPLDRIPLAPDSVGDPKALFVQLARGSRSSLVRGDLVPAAGSTALVGPGYNPRMIGFVRDTWDPTIAAEFSSSLARALRRLAE